MSTRPLFMGRGWVDKGARLQIPGRPQRLTPDLGRLHRSSKSRRLYFLRTLRSNHLRQKTFSVSLPLLSGDQQTNHDVCTVLQPHVWRQEGAPEGQPPSRLALSRWNWCVSATGPLRRLVTLGSIVVWCRVVCVTTCDQTVGMMQRNLSVSGQCCQAWQWIRSRWLAHTKASALNCRRCWQLQKFFFLHKKQNKTCNQG